MGQHYLSARKNNKEKSRLQQKGKNSQPVDEVVAAIRSKGGTAVPNYGKCISLATLITCCALQHRLC